MKTHSITRVVGYVGTVDRGVTQKGNFFATVSVAATERFLKKEEKAKPEKDRVWTEKTTWHRFKFLGEYWEQKVKRLEKGSPVEVAGVFQQDEYEDQKTGEKRWAVYFKPTFLNLLERSEKKGFHSEEEEQAVDAWTGEDIPF